MEPLTPPIVDLEAHFGAMINSQLTTAELEQIEATSKEELEQAISGFSEFVVNGSKALAKALAAAKITPRYFSAIDGGEDYWGFILRGPLKYGSAKYPHASYIGERCGYSRANSQTASHTHNLIITKKTGRLMISGKNAGFDHIINRDAYSGDWLQKRHIKTLADVERLTAEAQADMERVITKYPRNS